MARFLLDRDFINDGQMTKYESRVLAVSYLLSGGELASLGLLDIGAGSGSIGLEFLNQGGRSVYAVEVDRERAVNIRSNFLRQQSGDIDFRMIEGIDRLHELHELEGAGSLIEGKKSYSLLNLDVKRLLGGSSASSSFVERVLLEVDAVFVGGGLDAELNGFLLGNIGVGTVLVMHAVTVESSELLLANHRRFGGELGLLQFSRAEVVGGGGKSDSGVSASKSGLRFSGHSARYGFRSRMPLYQWIYRKFD